MLCLLLAFIISCTFALQSKAQNLVPNPSFEDTVSCPLFGGIEQVSQSLGWSAYRETPDYHHKCDIGATDYQTPADGDAYCALISINRGALGSNNYKEIIGRNLSSPLVVGVKYHVSLKVSLWDFSDCAINNIGVLFTMFPYTFSNPVPINNYAHVFSSNIISDTENWIVISGSFTADSAYKYIAVGSFFADSVIDYTHTNNSVDSSACSALYFVDDVCVSSDTKECDLLLGEKYQATENRMNVFPNPASDKIFVSTDKYQEIEYSLITLLGKKIRNEIKSDSYIDVSDLPEGAYLLEIKHLNQTFHKKQLIIY